MSLDFAVFCRNRPPLEGDHELGPVRVSAPLNRTDEDSWWLEQIPDAPTSNPGDWLVHMNCHSSAGEYADYLGTLIAERSGGGWVMCDAGEEAIRVPAKPSSAKDILPELQRLMQEAQSRRHEHEARQLELAKSEYKKAKQNDPSSHAEADDWSDL